ncbi:MAG TPA: CRISPR system precrRNA processing endoribonuclease RAMP protein Cas6 [Acidobacteriota bacterium]|nr:CRISPR system precrRNA processing endoribonuclease RAMP protein Cas6 [Acidobacteriota bacterium]
MSSPLVRATADQPSSWGALRLARVRYRFEALQPLRLPTYKGSTFRGALGKALKRTLCLRHRLPSCDGCHLMEACRYPDLFETRFSPRRNGRHPIPTPPFVLIPPDTPETDFETGRQLDCGLVLIGDALADAPSFNRAFAEIGRLGLGRGRAKCRLTQIDTLSPRDATPSDAPHTGPAGNRSDDLPNRPGGIIQFTAEQIIRDRSDWMQSRRWKMDFLTPTRLQNRGRLVEDPDFPVLMQRLCERVETLSRLYASDLRFDVEAILEEASRTRLIDSQIRWDDWERYSNRQQTRMRLGGFRGTATYEGNLSFFTPLLALGEWLNVGKGATFGLGRFQVHPL